MYPICALSHTMPHTQTPNGNPTQFVACMAHAGPMQHITSPPDPHAWQSHSHRLPNLAICTCTQYAPSHTQCHTHRHQMATPLSLQHAWHMQAPCSTSHHHPTPMHGSYGTICYLIWQYAPIPNMGPLAHSTTHRHMMAAPLSL